MLHVMADRCDIVISCSRLKCKPGIYISVVRLHYSHMCLVVVMLGDVNHETISLAVWFNKILLGTLWIFKFCYYADINSQFKPSVWNDPDHISAACDIVLLDPSQCPRCHPSDEAFVWHHRGGCSVFHWNPGMLGQDGPVCFLFCFFHL